MSKLRPQWATFMTMLIVLLGFTASPAKADTYPPAPGPTIRLSTSVVVEGVPFSAYGFNFAPKVKATLSIHSTSVVLGTATTDANGSFTIPAKLACSFPVGAHTITATAGGLSASASVTVKACSTTDVAGPVTSPASGSSGGLSFTGVAIRALLVLAIVLIIAGSVFVAANRRRASTS